MKRSFLLVFMLAAVVFLTAADFSSTTAGGNWNASATWGGQGIPGAADNVTINGPVIVNVNSYCLNLTVASAGQLSRDNQSRDLTINGNLVNHGVIKGPSLYLNITIHGDLYNHGLVDVGTRIYMEGAGVHKLQQSANAEPFKCNAFMANTGCGPLQLLSDIEFEGTAMILAGANLKLHHNGNGFTMSLGGGNLENANVEGAYGATLNLSGNAHLRTLSIDEIIFDGLVQIYSPVTVERLTNLGILQNNPGAAHTISINEKLENQGIIRNNHSSYSLNLMLKGDLFNSGEIDITRIDFDGSNQHNILQSATALPVKTAILAATAVCGPLQLLSDIEFDGTAMRLAGANLKLHHNGRGFTMSLAGGNLENANVEGAYDATLNLSGNAHLRNLSIDEIIFDGLVQIYSPVTVERLTNLGILQNMSGLPYTLIVNERLENHGVIRNHPTSYTLTVECLGNLANYGTINNGTFRIKGIQNQYLLMAPGSSENCAYFYLVSNVGAAKWYLNDNLMGGENYVAEKAIDTRQHGIWRHRNEHSAYGRTITIGSGVAVSQPQNFNISRNLDYLRLQWNEVTNANFYKIYAAAAPEGPWALLRIAHDHDPDDGIAFWEFYPTARHRFFKVTAQN